MMRTHNSLCMLCDVESTNVLVVDDAKFAVRVVA